MWQPSDVQCAPCRCNALAAAHLACRCPRCGSHLVLVHLMRGLNSNPKPCNLLASSRPACTMPARSRRPAWLTHASRAMLQRPTEPCTGGLAGARPSNKGHNACSSFSACLDPSLIAPCHLDRAWLCRRVRFPTAAPGRAMLPQLDRPAAWAPHVHVVAQRLVCSSRPRVLTDPAGTDGPNGNTGLLSPLTRIVATPCYRAPEVSSQHCICFGCCRSFSALDTGGAAMVHALFMRVSCLHLLLSCWVLAQIRLPVQPLLLAASCGLSSLVKCQTRHGTPPHLPQACNT